MFGLLDVPKMTAAAALGFLACYVLASFWWIPAAKQEERQAVQLAAAEAALNRIEDMEKNNADFLALPDRERCVLFMLDSGLPVDNCPD
ncbi:MAG: hypothetical protein ACK4P4_13295 [Allorhizobium sp.]